MKKRVLISWSGGLDSTALIYKYLQNNWEVDTVYIDIKNNSTKSKSEKNAIKKILPYLKDYKFKYLGECCDVHIKVNCKDDHISLKQPPIWLFGLYYVSDNDYDEIAIAYIMNDCAISYIDEIKGIWESYNKFTTGFDLPELKFPFIKKHKSELLGILPDKIIKHTVFCEYPIKVNNFSNLENFLTGDYTECGKCGSCKRRKFDENNGIPKKYHRFIKG